MKRSWGSPPVGFPVDVSDEKLSSRFAEELYTIPELDNVSRLVLKGLGEGVIQFEGLDHHLEEEVDELSVVVWEDVPGDE